MTLCLPLLNESILLLSVKKGSSFAKVLCAFFSVIWNENHLCELVKWVILCLTSMADTWRDYVVASNVELWSNLTIWIWFSVKHLKVCIKNHHNLSWVVWLFMWYKIIGKAKPIFGFVNRIVDCIWDQIDWRMLERIFLSNLINWIFRRWKID